MSTEAFRQEKNMSSDKALSTAAQKTDVQAQDKKDEKGKKSHRSTGLRLFDVFLYPFFTHFVVFGISVVATYLTSKGGDVVRNSDGEAIDKENKVIPYVYEEKTVTDEKTNEVVLKEDGSPLTIQVHKLDADKNKIRLDRDENGNPINYTADGVEKEPAGEEQLIYGSVGKFFQERGDWLVRKFEGMGMSHKTADMGKMVFFSFADGSLIAPFVKLFEDRREKIARWIDKRLGTEPEDASVYDAEPKQGWFSVLMGRLAVVSIVVPVAVLLNQKSKGAEALGKRIRGEEADEEARTVITPEGEAKLKKVEGTSWNDVFFNDPGKRVGEWVESKPELKKFFGKLDIPELFKTGFFEFFYTAVCTAGLFVSSRFIARVMERREDSAKPAASNSTQVSDGAANDSSSAEKNQSAASKGSSYSRVSPSEALPTDAALIGSMQSAQSQQLTGARV